VDKKIFGLSLIYSFLTIFFVVVLILPFRTIYQCQNFGTFYYYYPPFDFTDVLFVAKYVRFILSRGAIPFVAGFVVFIISMILFLKFSSDGSSRLSIVGYILGISSSGLLAASVIINYIVYIGRMMDLTSIFITIGIIVTQLNIGTLLFTKRNEFEYYIRTKRKIYRPVKIQPTIEEKPTHLEELALKHGTASILRDVQKPTEKIKEYCPFCGSEVMSDHLFCRKCGKKLK